MVAFHIFQSIEIAPLVVIYRVDLITPHALPKSPNCPGATAHIQNCFLLEIVVQNMLQHHMGGLVVARAKTHFGHDHDIIWYLRRNMEWRPYHTLVIDLYGLEVLFPSGIPILLNFPKVMPNFK